MLTFVPCVASGTVTTEAVSAATTISIVGTYTQVFGAVSANITWKTLAGEGHITADTSAVSQVTT
jgi:hypothetical protein